MKPKTDETSQLDKFKDAARELGCDDDEQRFKERLGKLTKARQSDRPPRTADDRRNQRDV